MEKPKKKLDKSDNPKLWELVNGKYHYKAGNCYEANANALTGLYNGIIPSDKLVHGTVWSRAINAYIDHCWIEGKRNGENVYFDFSNGNPIESAMFSEDIFLFFARNEGLEKKIYTRSQTIDNLYKSEHWGPWNKIEQQ